MTTPRKRGLPARLVAERRWNAARKAKEKRCTCGTKVWFGLDDDICASPASVEQDIVTLVEAQALLTQGLGIFYRDRNGNLWRLDTDNVCGRFVAHALLVEHVCQESA